MKEILTWAVDIENVYGSDPFTIYYRPQMGNPYWSDKPPVRPLWEVPESCPDYKSYIYGDEDQIGEPYLVKIKHIPESFEFERL